MSDRWRLGQILQRPKRDAGRAGEARRQPSFPEDLDRKGSTCRNSGALELPSAFRGAGPDIWRRRAIPTVEVRFPLEALGAILRLFTDGRPSPALERYGVTAACVMLSGSRPHGPVVRIRSRP